MKQRARVPFGLRGHGPNAAEFVGLWVENLASTSIASDKHTAIVQNRGGGPPVDVDRISD